MNELIVIAAVGAAAVGAALGAWALIDIGTTGVARYRRVFTERTHFSLRELFLFVDPARLFALNVALILACGVFGSMAGGPVAGLLLAALAAVAPRIVLARLRQRRLDQIEQQLPDALMMVAGALKAGLGLSVALSHLVREARPPLSQEFDLVLREQRLAVPLDTALENLNQRVPLQSITLAVAAMRIATETGGGLAEALERLAATLRAKLAMEGKIRALTAQGKLQGWVVGLLPVFLLLALLHLEPLDMGLVFTTQMGWATLTVIALLLLFGGLLIRKVVSIDV